jgi:type II secretory pathway pseudopilin PulG
MRAISRFRNAQQGVTLLEVVLAIAVFAFGMLALVQLQSGVGRSSVDATTRTSAANIAEELIERFKGFNRVIAFADERIDYAEIVSYATPETVNRGGIDYIVDVQVTDYYHVPDPANPDATPFLTEKPEGVVMSDFKLVEVGITWNLSQRTIDEVYQGELPELRVREIIASTPSLQGAKIAAEQADALGGPDVPFTPGENPDIVALQLDSSGDKFKESTSPQPDVIRGEFTQTWFDVVTYSKAGGDAIFLRREEFVAVTCECDLLTDVDQTALRPTLWNGYDYTEGEAVGKLFGARQAGSPKSLYCDVCCRDHHDGGSAVTDHVYNPLVAVGLDDHPHYDRDDAGNIEAVPAIPLSPEAGDSELNDYVEACRLVRKDGFMRATHDAVQKGLYGFPEEYLVFSSNVREYSNYVVDAVELYYETGEVDFDQPEDVGYIIPASTGATATNLPTPLLSLQQQLRSRGVYADYLTAEAKSNLENCFAVDGTPTPDNPDCNVPYATSPLELYPFFDLQLTWLNRWNEVPIGVPIEVDNEPVANYDPKTGQPQHSRGRAELMDPLGIGQTRGQIRSHKGNLGLTATGPIDPTYVIQTDDQDLYINANGDPTPTEQVGYLITGSLGSGAKGVKAADLLLSPDDALCGQTDVDFTCLVSPEGGTLTVSGYYKKGTALWVCSSALSTSATTPNPELNPDLTPVGGTIDTTFNLPGAELVDADIWVQDTQCSGP